MARSSAPVQAEDYLDDREAIMDFTTGQINGSGIGDLAVVSSEREVKDSAELMKFMEDPLVITIHTVSDPNASPVAYVGVQGESYWLPRGKKLKVKRKFVERLARSQSRHVETRENPDQSRADGFDTKVRSGSDYPFEVNFDPSPLGARWLRRVMAESR